MNYYNYQQYYNDMYYYNLMVYNQQLQNNKKKYIKKYNSTYNSNKKKLNIPIVKLNKYYDYTKNNNNDNPPSVNVLLNYYWPNYYNEIKYKKNNMATKIKKQLIFEEKNKDWISFYQNNK